MSKQYLMKGKVYGERKHLLTYPLFAEIKYDEIRLHVRYTPSFGVEFLAYSGKRLHNLDSFAKGFEEFFAISGLSNLDLGLLVNGNFNDSYRWARSSTGVPKEKLDKATGTTHPALDLSMVEFYVFDVPEHPGPYTERRSARRLQADRLAYCIPGTKVNVPESWCVTSEAELDRLFLEVRERGLEGLMVKTADHTYVSGCGNRSDGWLKMKPEETFDGKITAINQARSIAGEPLERAGSIDVLLEDGSTASPAGIAHLLGEDMWEHPESYIGRWVEFKCMERDRQGGYRHPSFVRFREAKQ